MAVIPRDNQRRWCLAYRKAEAGGDRIHYIGRGFGTKEEADKYFARVKDTPEYAGLPFLRVTYREPLAPPKKRRKDSRRQSRH